MKVPPGSLQPPNAANSEEEYLKVYNLDLRDKSTSELENEINRASRIADSDPGAFVWRGLNWITAREWADERVELCRELLGTHEREEQAVLAGEWSPWQA